MPPKSKSKSQYTQPPVHAAEIGDHHPPASVPATGWCAVWFLLALRCLGPAFTAHLSNPSSNPGLLLGAYSLA